MGLVHEAVSADGRRVAIKSLLKSANPDARERFRREAEGQARSDGHPNVVRIHSAGVHAGLPFLVTELLSGGTLSERLKRGGQMEPADAIEIVSALADGLAHAHSQGILHRDVKPANVLFDEAGTPKLGDFGLAQLPDAETLTRTGQVMGTLGYMAPEMIDDARRAGPAADVYSLGAVLFACLAGRPPLPAGTQINRIMALLREPAPLLRTQRPDAPPVLEEICARALARDPAERFTSAAALAETLRGVVSGSVSSAPKSRMSLLLGLALGVLTITGLGLGVAFWPQAEVPQESVKPTRTMASRAPDLVTWRLPASGELRYRVLWNEAGFQGAASRADSVLVLQVSPLSDPNRRRVEIRWVFSEFASIQVGLPPVVVPTESLKRAGALTAFVGELDLVSGAWTVLQTPAAIHEQVFSGRDPRLHEPGSRVALSAEDWLGTWASSFFNKDRLPRLLELLFARSEVSKTDFRWNTHPGFERGRASRKRALYPYLWTLPVQYVRERGPKESVEAEGERKQKGGLPSSLTLTQRVTILDERFAEDTLEIELLPGQ